MLTPDEAQACAAVVEVDGTGKCCKLIRESRNLPQGTDAARELLQAAVGASLWLMPEAEIAKRLREFAGRIS